MRTHRVPSSICFALSLGVAAATLDCATSLQVTARPAPAFAGARSVYLVAHDESRGVEASVQKELFRRGFIVTVGAAAAVPTNVDLVVRYNEDWTWDLTMYLRRAGVMFYDGRTGALIGAADWKNSPFHGFYGVDPIVSKLLDGICSQVGIPVAGR